MPTIDIEVSEFEALLGMHFNGDTGKIDNILAYVKGEIKAYDEKTGVISVEIKDTNRPDVWNVEGLTRTLKGFLGLKEGLQTYTVNKESGEVYVDERLEKIRPFIGCSINKSLKLTDSMIRGFMRLQDKLDQSYGRNRQRTSIGLYNLDLIKLPLHYSVTKPEDISFIPLGFSEKMNLKQILTNHPKGLEYGHIVRKHPLYPILLDSENTPLSFPPIINSNDLGRITESTRNILVEVTGTSLEAVLNTLKIVTLSLIDRGGKASSTRIHYMQETQGDMITPDFATRTVRVNLDYARRITGLQFTAKQVTKLLAKAGYAADKQEADEVTIRVPCYRTDVMHPVDIIEDIAIAYDYNNIKPVWRESHTTGTSGPEQSLIDLARELVIGLGFQETLNYTLTNPENLFTKMNMKKGKVIEVSNPKVITMTCLRNWLLPGLLEFISNNLHVELPQKIFELGKITVPDLKRETKSRDDEALAAVTYTADASFTHVKAVLDSFFTNIGLQYELQECKHRTFIEGRTASIIANRSDVGVMGEIHPSVLQAWKLENPASAFELNMTEIIRLKTRNTSSHGH